jgi:hypothetical protein
LAGAKVPFKLAHQLVEEDNKAVAVSLAGFIAALGIVASSSISDFGDQAHEAWGGFDNQFKASEAALLLCWNLV